MEYKPEKVCSTSIMFEVENNKLKECRFIGGCAGNAKGLVKCIIGQDIDWIIEKLKDTRCRNGTSCPDQLAIALQKYKDSNIEINK